MIDWEKNQIFATQVNRETRNKVSSHSSLFPLNRYKGFFANVLLPIKFLLFQIGAYHDTSRIVLFCDILVIDNYKSCET